MKKIKELNYSNSYSMDFLRQYIIKYFIGSKFEIRSYDSETVLFKKFRGIETDCLGHIVYNIDIFNLEDHTEATISLDFYDLVCLSKKIVKSSKGDISYVR